MTLINIVEGLLTHWMNWIDAEEVCGITNRLLKNFS